MISGSKEDTVIDDSHLRLNARSGDGVSLASALSSAPSFAVGSRVKGRYEGQFWSKGLVVRVNDDSTYAIDYDDGDKETSVPPDCIIPESAKPPCAAPQPRSHAVLRGSVSAELLCARFEGVKRAFEPQAILYGPTSKHWNISCWMDSDPYQRPRVHNRNEELAACMDEVLVQCDDRFSEWYRRLHGDDSIQRLQRAQSFVTRYRPRTDETGLPRHVDGCKVDGSVILQLPTDVPFSGGGLTVWEGQNTFDYSGSDGFQVGDMCLLDNMVWHQGNPITSGERWSLVIFYYVREKDTQKKGGEGEGEGDEGNTNAEYEEVAPPPKSNAPPIQQL